ncbi:MAG TPA: YD repeat-containing protein, partial [Flavobacterium sp.]|nr:YD repeat-containing protein [Flavobacterium sp.]
EYVTVSYGGDNFELGGKQKQFVNKSSSTYQEIHPFYVSPFQNEHAMYRGNLQYIYEGTLLSEMEIMKRGNTLYKVSEQKYEYDYIPYGNGITGVIGGYAHMNCGYPTDGADNLDIAKFEFMSKKVHLISKSTKEFVVPMPLTVDALFEANYKPVTSVTEYSYEGLPGLATKVKTTVSENNNFIEVRNTYADQAVTLSGLTADQLTAYTKLVEKNKINQPIEVKTYRTDNSLPVLVTTNRTLYKNWGTTLDLILPEMIQQSKGSRPLEDRVQFKAYDNRGNLTLLTMDNGARTRYEYDGYDNLKARIENYTGSDAVPDQAPNIPVDFEPGTPAPCTLGAIYPGATVTWYYYDTFTRLLRRTVDGNCRSTYYEYDALLRLKRIKDHEGNIIEEYDTNYKLN